MVAYTLEELKKRADFVWIHDRKELENFLLVPSALDRAVETRIRGSRERGGSPREPVENMAARLSKLTDEIKSELFGQYLASGVKALQGLKKGMDPASASAVIHSELEGQWSSLEGRLKLVPGKALLAKLNEVLQQECGVSITTNVIVASMKSDEIPEEVQELVRSLEIFSRS